MTAGEPADRKTGHPEFSDLALYATAGPRADLQWWRRLKIRRHLRGCEECRSFVAGLERSQIELRREAETETLTGFEAIADWSRMEAEMIGNISVGLSAARCVDGRSGGRRWLYGSLATAGLTLLFAAGWVTHIPQQETEQLFARIGHWAGAEPTTSLGTVMRSSPDGIAVRSQGLTLTMRHPRSATVSVAGSSTIEARFVDEETGQVTISSVYGQ